MSLTSFFVFFEFFLTDDHNMFKQTKFFQLRLSTLLFAFLAFICSLITELVIPSPSEGTRIFNPIVVLTLIPGTNRVFEHSCNVSTFELALD